MAQNVVINGVTYPAVEAVALTDSNGNTIPYYPDAVRYVPQTLTEAQKAQARQNIGAQAVLTEADKEAIVQQVITALGTPVFGRVDADNNIILTGELADGTYTLKYEDADGEVTEIGTLSLLGMVNLADPKSGDWAVKCRFKSDCSMVSDGNSTNPNTLITNYIPVKAGDVVRVKGLNIRIVSTDNVPPSTTNTRSVFFNASKAVVGSVVPNNTSACVESGDMWTYTIAEGVSGINTSDIAYIRFNGTLYSGYTANDVIITVNQEIE